MTDALLSILPRKSLDDLAGNYAVARVDRAALDAVLAQAAQDLITRVAQAYVDVLLSADNVAFAGAQKTAIAEQLQQAKISFQVGTATITDTHEAQARFDLATSQEIAAKSDLDVKQRALELLIGKAAPVLAPLSARLQLTPPETMSARAVVESATIAARRALAAHGQRHPRTGTADVLVFGCRRGGCEYL